MRCACLTNILCWNRLPPPSTWVLRQCSIYCVTFPLVFFASPLPSTLPLPPLLLLPSLFLYAPYLSSSTFTIFFYFPSLVPLFLSVQTIERFWEPGSLPSPPFMAASCRSHCFQGANPASNVPTQISLPLFMLLARTGPIRVWSPLPRGGHSPCSKAFFALF